MLTTLARMIYCAITKQNLLFHEQEYFWKKIKGEI
jgi:hypothetical protein